MTELENWMGIYIPNDRVLRSIILPGTHNSGAYKVNVDVDLPKIGVPDVLVDAGKNIGEWIIEQWTCTHEISVKKQMVRGVRALDLRVAKINKEFWVCHTFACVPLIKVLKHIQRFADQHPQEIVYIRMAKDYANRTTMTKDRHDIQLFELVGEYLGKRLYRGTNFNVEVGELRENHTNVLLNYDEPHQPHPAILSLPVYKINEWPSDLKTKKKLLNQFEKNAPANDGHGVNRLEMTLTPDAEAIKSDILNPLDGSNGILGLTLDIRKVMFRWMDKMELEKFNTIEVDFVQPDFIRYIIGKNKM